MQIAKHIRNVFRDRTAEHTERYLSQATSLADLELREREIDRGRFSGRAFH